MYKYIDAVLVESVYYGLDKNNKYKVMDKEDTKWMMEKLNKIKSLGLPVIVVDYVDSKNNELAQQAVQAIAAQGFIPYVSDRFLSKIGFVKDRPIPRKIVLLFDSSIPTEKKSLFMCHTPTCFHAP